MRNETGVKCCDHCKYPVPPTPWQYRGQGEFCSSRCAIAAAREGFGQDESESN